MSRQKRVEVARKLCKVCNWQTKDEECMLADLDAIADVLEPLYRERYYWHSYAGVLLGFMVGFGTTVAVVVLTQ